MRLLTLLLSLSMITGCGKKRIEIYQEQQEQAQFTQQEEAYRYILDGLMPLMYRSIVSAKYDYKIFDELTQDKKDFTYEFLDHLAQYYAANNNSIKFHFIGGNSGPNYSCPFQSAANIKERYAFTAARPGAPICFDLEAIAKDKLNIHQLTSLIFHELGHHIEETFHQITTGIAPFRNFHAFLFFLNDTISVPYEIVLSKIPKLILAPSELESLLKKELEKDAYSARAQFQGYTLEAIKLLRQNMGEDKTYHLTYTILWSLEDLGMFETQVSFSTFLFSNIKNNPLQVYITSLIFAPSNIIHNFEIEEQRETQQKIKEMITLLLHKVLDK